MISDQVQKRILPDKIPGAVERMGVSARFRLMHEANHGGEIARRPRVGCFIRGCDDEADLLHLCGQRLFDDDPQDGFFGAVAID